MEKHELKDEVKERPVRPVYIRFGRGSETDAMLLDPEIVKLVKSALLDLTTKGEMATGGGTTGRTPKGREQSQTIFKLVKLLEKKAD